MFSYLCDCFCAAYVDSLESLLWLNLMKTGRNKREQRKNIYKDVKRKEIESSSESSYTGLKTAESTGRRQKLSLKNKKKKKMKVETVCDDSEDDSLSLVPEFTITIKKSYLTFLVREKQDKTCYSVKLVYINVSY